MDHINYNKGLIGEFLNKVEIPEDTPKLDHIDYNEIFNGPFLKTIEIPEDTPKWNIRIIMEKEDHKNINDIFNKKENEFKALNHKEIDTLKKFTESMDLHKNQNKNDKSDDTIREIVNDILHLPIEKLLVFISENQITGLFNISTGYFNGEIYLGVSEGKSNVSNNLCYSDSVFIEIYKKFIKRSFELYISNKNEISDNLLDSIIQYELTINQNKMSSVKRRDVNETINIYDINEIKFENYNFQTVISNILNKAGIKYPKNKIIFDEKMPFNYYSIIDKYLKEPNFRYYIVWCFLSQIGGYTFNKLNSIKFELIQIIKGISKQMIYSKKKIVICNELIGHLISKEYLSIIDPNIQPNIAIMVEYIQKMFHNRLINNTWMDKKTKEKAVEKLDNMKFVIGTDALIDFSNIESLVSNNYVANFKSLVNYVYYYRIKFLDKKYYERLLYGNIYDINAYYDPTLNLMIFPYGILRKPYFHTTNMTNLYDVKKIAHNFGAIGSVIGHEMIHGFDDQGRKFDKNGHLNKNSSWWEEESETKYKVLADEIIEEYKKYKLNPHLTLGENIADVGGLRVTYDAMRHLIDENYEDYKKSKKTQVETKDELIMISNQSFIKAWCMIWRTKIKPQEYENHILNDPHSPAHARVNVPLNFIFKESTKKSGNQISDKLYDEKEITLDKQIW